MMESELFSFENLKVYQKSRQLVVQVYKLLKNLPSEERFALCDQLRRSVISVPSNIAEQSGRKSTKEKRHFLEISYGSLLECYCQLQIACDLKYISEDELKQIKSLFYDVSRLLNGLHKSFGTHNP